MNNPARLFAFSILCSASLSPAQQIIHTGDFVNNPGVFPFAGTFSAPQFDPELGVLTSVVFELSSSSSAQVEGENNAEGPAEQTASLVGETGATFGPLEVTLSLAQSVGPVPLAATDEPFGAATDFAGDDYHNFGFLSDSDTQSISIFDPVALQFYIGNGQIGGTYTDIQGWAVFSGGDAATRVTNSQSQSTWRVIYNYTSTNIPETSSSVLALTAGFALLARRKR